MAVTDPEADPYRRASLIVVPTDTLGYCRVRNIACMGHAGDDWASHAELVFDQCRVPRENLLGEEGAGFAMAQARLGPGRIQHTMRWMGVCRRALEMMCGRAAIRRSSSGRSAGCPANHPARAAGWRPVRTSFRERAGRLRSSASCAGFAPGPAGPGPSRTRPLPRRAGFPWEPGTGRRSARRGWPSRRRRVPYTECCAPGESQVCRWGRRSGWRGGRDRRGGRSRSSRSRNWLRPPPRRTTCGH
jgi:hypothetical protein